MAALDLIYARRRPCGAAPSLPGALLGRGM